jgi:hypothetical protein
MGLETLSWLDAIMDNFTTGFIMLWMQQMVQYKVQV